MSWHLIVLVLIALLVLALLLWRRGKDGKDAVVGDGRENAGFTNPMYDSSAGTGGFGAAENDGEDAGYMDLPMDGVDDIASPVQNPLYDDVAGEGIAEDLYDDDVAYMDVGDEEEKFSDVEELYVDDAESGSAATSESDDSDY
jgi:hypothetical protein